MINRNNDSEKLITPINITWMITNRCNYHCEFCFRFFDKNELDYPTAKKITDKLIDGGMKKMSWAGGEPLLWPNMMDLIEYTSSRGVMTMIITNGELITKEIATRLKQTLDWLNLPLDGSTSEMSNRMTRKIGHFERTIEHLKNFQNTGVKLKINTVAASINIEDIVNMVPIIKRYKIKRWKIFQFYPVRGAAIDSRQKFELDVKKFEQVREQVNQMIDPQECMVVFENNKELDKSYFALTPDGLVYVSINGKDIFLGDLKTQEVRDIWDNPWLDKQKYWNRSNWIIE